MTQLAQQIEALLFLAGEAINTREFVRLTGQSRAAVITAITELTQALQDHGLTLVSTEDHVQLTTSQHVGSFVARFLEDVEHMLSAAAAETLALVAYRGPISRYEIEALRGVDSRRIIQQLLLRGLVRHVAPSARPRHYVVTEEFLSHLGIKHREELPSFDDLSSHEKLLAILKRENKRDDNP